MEVIIHVSKSVPTMFPGDIELLFPHNTVGVIDRGENFLGPLKEYVEAGSDSSLDPTCFTLWFTWNESQEDSIYRSSLVAYAFVKENTAMLDVLASMEFEDTSVSDSEILEIIFLRILAYVFGTNYDEIVLNTYNNTTDKITFDEYLQEWLEAGLMHQTAPQWIGNLP